MPAICTSPTSPDCVLPGTQPRSVRPHPISLALSHLQDAVREQRHRLITAFDQFTSNTVSTESFVVGMEAGRVRAAERYMKARLAGQNDDVLRLVTDDIILTSSRDGVVEGKSKFADYISKVKPTGQWRKAHWNGSIGKAEVAGTVRILMVSVPVVAHFGFDRKGKISRIYVGTRRKASK